MQHLLFPPENRPGRKPAPPAEQPKRGRGRPPMDPDEKARKAAEREANPVLVGTSRMNAGRPRNDGTHRHDDTDVAAGSVKATVQEYNQARAKRETAAAIKEDILAKKAILEFEVQQGNYLPRDAIISAVARAYSALSQGIRSIPDLLERRLGLDPSICVKIGEIQDEALASLHVDLEKMLMSDEEKGAENGQ